MKKLKLILPIFLMLFETSSNATVILKKGTFYRQNGHDDPSQNLQVQTISCLKSESTCFTANINNGSMDTIMCINANELNVILNHNTTISVNGSIIASGLCKSIFGQEVLIPEFTTPIDNIEFKFQN